MFKRKKKEVCPTCYEGYLYQPHVCDVPHLLFRYPMMETRTPLGTVWRCRCGKLWESVAMWHDHHNEWKEAK